MSSTTTNATLDQAPALEERAPNEASVVRAVTLAHCLRCGFEWLPRKEHPVRCGRCRSPLWNVPRAQQLPGKPAPTRKGKARGKSFSPEYNPRKSDAVHQSQSSDLPNVQKTTE
ncbi:MAG TPA: hypothetical protein VF627_09180 [Abditibacterium sp.]|jgi:DNA-directed RNA polymerase subunit RPC12/RpoP